MAVGRKASGRDFSITEDLYLYRIVRLRILNEYVQVLRSEWKEILPITIIRRIWCITKTIAILMRYNISIKNLRFHVSVSFLFLSFFMLFLVPSYRSSVMNVISVKLQLRKYVFLATVGITIPDGN